MSKAEFDLKSLEQSSADGLSRRNFIRGAAAGATGAALVLGGPGKALAKSTESGLVTLDALILTYFGAPLGEAGSSSWELSRSYDFTLNLEAVEAPGVLLRGNGPGQEEAINKSEFAQIRSTLVKDAITSRFNRGDWTRLGLSTDGTYDATVGLAMLKPKFEFTGTPNKLRFRFVDAGDTLTFDVPSLLHAEALIRRSTASSFLESAYVTEASMLIEPRFKLIQSVEFIGEQTLGASIRLHSGAPGLETAGYTAEIIESSGFNSDVLKRAFEAGKRLKVTLSSAQEFKSTIRFSATVRRATFGASRVYFDKVFKTFVISNG